MILCDIGNTTFHFKTKIKDFKIDVKDSIMSFFSKDKKIYFISVNQKATKKLLKYYPKAINLEKHIKINSSYIGIGIDRKIVSSYIQNGIIIDAGSAVTVDIIKKGIHLGGFILPGIRAYSKIYPIISKKLSFQFSNNINLDKIPLNTNDAINYAILMAIILPIQNINKKYGLPLYFTGGDGKILSKYFKKKKYKKNLIFKSMKKNIKENRC
jgi:type III pantothenate kinase